MTGEPLLSVRDLTVAFATENGSVRAADGVSLDLAAGEILALVGESGSGKSVTALSIMGLLGSRNVEVGGSVRFDGGELLGAPVTELQRVRGAEVAMIFQDPLSALNPVMRIGDQIAEQILAHEDVAEGQAADRAVALLRRVGIPRPEARARGYAHELSGGMRQRSMIAMALSCKPRVLIADEPTTALDVTVQAQILDLIRELRDETGAAVLFVTHDLAVVAELADRVAVMDAGRIVEQATVEQLFDSPGHPRTRALLEAVPRLDGPLGGGLATPPGEPLLELEHLEVRFRSGGGVLGRGGTEVRAVDDVTLALAPGEALGLVGESGCGKTTLARAALRLIDPSSGSIRFAGRDITSAGRRELASLRGELQIVFQDPKGSLNPRKRVREIVGLPLRMGGTAAGAIDARVLELLAAVRLAPELAARWPHELSGGQAQRVGIARALAREPRLLVLDEPVSALDVTVQAQVVDLLADLRRDLGIALLFVAHDLSVVRQVSDRVAVMYLGKLVELGPAEALYARPAHPYTATLLEAVPVPDPHARPRSGERPVETAGDAGVPATQPAGCVFHPRCAHATEICRAVEPPLTHYPDGRVAACHHPRNVTPDELSAATRSPDSPLGAGVDAPAAA